MSMFFSQVSMRFSKVIHVNIFCFVFLFRVPQTFRWIRMDLNAVESVISVITTRNERKTEQKATCW